MIPPALHKNMAEFDKRWKKLRGEFMELDEEQREMRLREILVLDREWLAFSTDQRVEAMKFYHRDGIPLLAMTEKPYVPEFWPQFPF